MPRPSPTCNRSIALTPTVPDDLRPKKKKKSLNGRLAAAGCTVTQGDVTGHGFTAVGQSVGACSVAPERYAHPGTGASNNTASHCPGNLTPQVARCLVFIPRGCMSPLRVESRCKVRARVAVLPLCFRPVARGPRYTCARTNIYVVIRPCLGPEPGRRARCTGLEAAGEREGRA